ncbi:DNA gyrase inhibitor YacG [Glaciecola sp. MH2013]|uniref:DNA gyrase inhibitor YacG n=1 Tax=Glaciecola sp. MH2013 TaxID=2785524 RepID=UPI00189CC8D0|nr:DNA gyrase inhibitor YacG [Glaciecola sp. MH2013]MBF7072058.1 DNA gyrase inhibitor YacG [Glaciecola sp. MH2013]
MNVNCPTCKKKVEWIPESEFRPFCCKRCQLIDLGQWANEENAIPSGANKDSEMELPGIAPDIDIEQIEAMLADQEKDFFKE